VAALRVHFLEIFQGSRIHPALPQLFLHHWQIFPNKAQIKHELW